MSPWWSVLLVALLFVLVDMVGEIEHFHKMLGTAASEKACWIPWGKHILTTTLEILRMDY